MDLASSIQSVVNLLPNAAYSYSPNEPKLDALLTHLIQESAIVGATARLDSCSVELVQFLKFCSDLLGNVQVRPITRSKLLLVFSNLCLFNISLRKSAANNVRMCQAVYHCLELAMEEKLGPQNKIDILRLIQMLTYEKIEFADWTHKFSSLLISEILSASPSELLPYSMSILANLVSQSRNFTNILKQKEFYNCLCKRILQLLSHNSKAIVLVGYLDENTRDTVYSPQNLSQTILCIFNILNTSSSSSSDALMTTHIAVDLLRKLVVCQPKMSNEPPMLNQTARNFATYSFFATSIQNLTSLLNVFDPRSEESRKILNLLLTFCQIDELKAPISLAITAVEPTETKLTTPVSALLRIAGLSFEEAIFPELPITALRLLTIIIRESTNANRSLRKIFFPISPLLHLVKQTLGEPKIQTNSPLASFQAIRIAEGLKLAEALNNDEDIRFDLLDLVSSQQCSAIFEHQLDSNPVAYTNFASTSGQQSLDDCGEDGGDQRASTSHQRTPNLPLWSINAVSIPIQLMQLLASFKDYSKPHKELYWRSLKDLRLLPFLAFALARGDHELIYDAFVLLIHCAQVHEFPLRMLSKLTSKCASLRKTKAMRQHNKCKDKSESSPDASYELANGINGKKQSNSPTTDRVDELSQMIASLQAKLARKQSREEELERMLLQQQGTRENIQHFVGDLEKCVASGEAREAALLKEKAQFVEKMEQLEREKRLLVEENDKERALHSILRGKFDEMTQKFDTAAKAVFEKQLELEQMTARHRTQADRIAEMERDLERKEKEILDARETMAEQRKDLDAKNAEIAQLQTKNHDFVELKEAMAKLLGKTGDNNG